MIVQHIDINGYWDVAVHYGVRFKFLNSGSTLSDMRNRRSLVKIGIADSKRQMLNTIVHEAKHVQSHICEYYRVAEDGEQAAYLEGYLVMRMYDTFKKLL